MKLRYHPLTEKDIEQVVDYYHGIMPSLAEELLDELDNCVKRILREPLRFRLIRGDLRKSGLKRFPYPIYFLIENDSIRLLFLKHNRRHPSYGMDRLIKK